MIEFLQLVSDHGKKIIFSDEGHVKHSFASNKFPNCIISNSNFPTDLYTLKFDWLCISSQLLCVSSLQTITSDWIQCNPCGVIAC